MAGATVAASLPSIQRAFVDTENVALLTRLVVTMPALAIAVLSPVSGWLVDRFGRTRLLYSAMLLYGVAGVTGGLVNDIYVLLVFRFLLGVSVAMTMTSVLTLVGDYYEGVERARFLGIQAAFMGFGGVIFITLGGWLASMSWRGPFFLYAAAFAFLPLAIWFLKEPELNADQSVDEDTESPLESGGTLDRPLAAFVYFVLVIMFIIFYAVPTQVPFYIEYKFGVNSTAVGFAVAAITLSSAVVSLLYQRVKQTTSYLGVFGYTFFFTGLAFLFLSWSSLYPLAVFSLLIGGLGMGLLMPNSSVWLMDLAPVEMRGRVMGGMTTAVFLGQFISPLVTQPMVTRVGAERSFILLGTMLIIATAVTLLSTSLFKRWS